MRIYGSIILWIVSSVCQNQLFSYACVRLVNVCQLLITFPYPRWAKLKFNLLVFTQNVMIYEAKLPVWEEKALKEA